MKPVTKAIAIIFAVFIFDSCTSSTSTPEIVNVQKIAEGGSSQDTLNIKADENESAIIFERMSAEGGSSRDTIYLRPKTRARFYKANDFKFKKKP